ncbi:DMT family transporter [Mesorhizobium sp. Cs1299R1N1]|uniref:DMT family transporter n=1 Tax=Mesorhizobium sp. Cs1299R1N1 TaxID=3015172 RepID=UPI00301E0F15
MKKLSTPPLTIMDLGLVAMWSSGYVGAKLASETGSVLLILFWRFLLISLVLAPISVRYVIRRGFRSLWINAVLGVCAMFLQIGCAIVAIDMGMPAGNVSIIYALQPLLTAAVAGPILGERVAIREWVGLAVAFVGVSLAGGFGGLTAPGFAYFLTILGTVGIVTATVVAKVFVDDTPILPGIGIQSTFCAMLFCPLALIDGGLSPPLHDAKFWFVVGWFILFSTLGAYALYWLCLRRSSAVHVGSVLYLTPVVTIAVSGIFFGEPITAAKILGVAVCLTGGGIALSRKNPATLHQRR